MPLLHLVFNIVIIVILFTLGLFLRGKKKTRYIEFSVVILLFLLSLVAIFRPDIFIRLFPFADLIFYSNIFPFSVAIFIPCAITIGKTKFQKIRIGILCAVLLGVSFLPYKQFYIPLAKCHNVNIDENGICWQSSNYTCSAASIVTMLRLYDIETNEEEVVKLALTRTGVGTTHLGVYRALKILTKERDDLKVSLRKMSADELMERGKPAVISVGIPGRNPTMEQLKFASEYSWMPGVLHDVVYMKNYNEKKVLIGEPDFGQEKWPKEHLRFLFQSFAASVE